MFSNLQFTQRERYLVWAFAFVFSPTVSVLLVGQSSLFVLFTVLSTVVLCDLGKSWTAGFGLALALTKPHLAFSLVFLLLFRRRYRITIIGIVVFVALGIGGLYLGHSGLDAYLQGLRRYASWNGAAGNPRLVGIQSLATRALGLSDSVGRTLSGVSASCYLASHSYSTEWIVAVTTQRTCSPCCCSSASWLSGRIRTIWYS